MKLPEQVVNVALVISGLCAIASLGLALSRAGSSDDVEPGPNRVTAFADWEAYDVGGHLIGPDDAALTVVEFSDFECPYCASAARGVLRSFRDRYPKNFAVRYREAPGPRHRFAIPAARAAACAGQQGRFTEYHDLLFASQDSLGLIPFERLASRAAVTDLDAFSACLSSEESLEGLNRDTTAARRIGLRGTPTFVVPGSVIVGIPDSAMLEGLLKEALRHTKAS